MSDFNRGGPQRDNRGDRNDRGTAAIAAGTT